MSRSPGQGKKSGSCSSSRWKKSEYLFWLLSGIWGDDPPGEREACAKCDQPRSPVGVGENTAPGSSRLDQSDPSTISQMTRNSPAALASCSACRIFSALSGSSSSIVTNRIFCCLPACSSLLSLASRFMYRTP